MKKDYKILLEIGNELKHFKATARNDKKARKEANKIAKFYIKRFNIKEKITIYFSEVKKSDLPF